MCTCAWQKVLEISQHNSFTYIVWAFLQIAASSNAMFLTDQDCDDQNTSLLNFPAVERSEKEPLLLQYGTLSSS